MDKGVNVQSSCIAIFSDSYIFLISSVESENIICVVPFVAIRCFSSMVQCQKGRYADSENKDGGVRTTFAALTAIVFAFPAIKELKL